MAVPHLFPVGITMQEVNRFVYRRAMKWAKGDAALAKASLDLLEQTIMESGDDQEPDWGALGHKLGEMEPK